MKTTWDSIRHFVALILISISFAYNALIWSTPPSLGYLGIFAFSAFTLIMTLSWVVTFLKSNSGKILLGINLGISILSIVFLMNESGSFEKYQQSINIIGNIIAAIMTIVLGTMNFKKIKMNAPNT
jgi:hypothetical protein